MHTTAAEHLSRAQLAAHLDTYRKQVAASRPTLDISGVCAWRCASVEERAALLESAGLAPAFVVFAWSEFNENQRDAIRAGSRDANVREVIARGLA